MDNAWKQLAWDGAARARAIALACRLDRQLEEVVGVAARPESRLAGRLRTELQATAEEAATTEALFAAVEAIHEQLAYLPKPGMPTGVRVFLRELFGHRWDEDVVVAAVATVRWPLARVAASPERPITVIPRADIRNPLMWPLIALQGASLMGWTDAERQVGDVVGPGLLFAMAEAMLLGGVSGTVDAGGSGAERGGEGLWERGRDALVEAGALYDHAMGLAASLADGVLISARRVGRGATTSVGSSSGDIYERLAAVRDVPADAVEILTAGWIHWYGHAAPQLLKTADWSRRREIVDGVDDVLCRSLDVASIHRFYATEGASA